MFGVQHNKPIKEIQQHLKEDLDMNKLMNNKPWIAALVLAIAGMSIAVPASAQIVVDPYGHDQAVMERDVSQCRDLSNSVEFGMIEEQRGRAVLRGAAVAGGAAAIAGGGKEVRRRSVGMGALAGGVARNQAKRSDRSVEEAKRNEAQRNCLIGRGYNPIN